MPENKKVTETTEEAMDLLGEHKGYYIAMARWVGVQIMQGKEPWVTYAQNLGLSPGEVHSFAIRVALEKHGIMEGYTGKYHFMGTAMRDPIFKSTGRSVSYSYENIHQRTIGVRVLRPGSAPGAVMEPKMPDDLRERLEKARAEEAEVRRIREGALAKKHGGAR